MHAAVIALNPLISAAGFAVVAAFVSSTTAKDSSNTSYPNGFYINYSITSDGLGGVGLMLRQAKRKMRPRFSQGADLSRSMSTKASTNALRQR